MSITKYINGVILIFSSVFLLDLFLLPKVKLGTTVTSIYRPKTMWGSRTKLPRQTSKEEVIVKTSKGLIKVSPNYLNKLKQGDSLIISNTAIFNLSTSILLVEQSRSKKSSNPVYSWFLFIPVLMIVISLVCAFVREAHGSLNLRYANFSLFLFFLFLLLKDYFR